MEKHLNTSFKHDESALSTFEPADDIQIKNIQDITKEEIKTATWKTKSNKVPGADEITVEVVKAGGEGIIDLLRKIFNKILSTEKSSDDFSKMIALPIYKKGNGLKRENYCVIELLSIYGKIFLRVLLDRIQSKVNGKLKERQFLFCAGRRAVDAIFCLTDHRESK